MSDFSALSRWLASRGRDVVILAPAPLADGAAGWDSTHALGAAREALSDHADVRLLPYRLNDGRGLNPWTALKTLVLAGWLSLAKRNSAFILWSALPIVLFAPAVRAMGRPALLLITGLGIAFSDHFAGSWRGRAVRALYRWVLSGPRIAVVVHNYEDKARLLELARIDPHRITVTGGCGVDPAAFPFRERLRMDSAEEPPRILVPVRL
ncbi:MAG: hypothetical protein WEC33_06945, partial [Dehalococcoidia bacterium]